MIRKICSLFIAFGLLTSGLVACSAYTRPVDNITQSTADHPSASRVGKAIKAAAISRGWKVTQVRPGLITADLHLRGTYAAIKIPYSSKGYSIKYAGSRNLEYSNGQIHHNYNRWVGFLNQSIQARLAR